MRVLSFDVGIRNLAGCVIEWNESLNLKSNLSIHYWDIINVVDNKKVNEIPHICLHTDCKMKPKSYIEFNNIKYCFCTRHLKDNQTLTNHIFEPYTDTNFTEIIQTENICCIECNQDNIITSLTKRKKTLYKNTIINKILCAKHHKQLISKITTSRKKIISFSKT